MSPNLKRRKFLVTTIGVAGLVGMCFLPVSDSLPHPRTVKLQFEGGVEPQFRLNVIWYDRGLNRNFFSKTFDFDSNGIVIVPPLKVPSLGWRLVSKRFLSLFDNWTSCQHCYGPWVDCSLKRKGEITVPDKMRLAQNREEQGESLLLKVSLIPDETKYEPRELKVQDHQALLTEARTLIARGALANIQTVDLGPQLQQLNPVRVECRDKALILWMGGKIGYAIVPDSAGCPAMNRTWIMGTDFPHIFKLERM